MSATDPLNTVWEALERVGCGPHGPPWDFRAKCPHHDGDNPEALHITVGGDGRALVHCFAHDCRVEDIVAALGLSMADLFPPGHKHARRRRLPEARRRVDFRGNAAVVANTLAALELLGRDWYLELRTDCPHCGSPLALMQAAPRFVLLSCPGDDVAERLGYTACTLDQFLQAFAGRVEDRKRAA